MAQAIRMEALYWKRLDTTTWNVLKGVNTQSSGGGNRHVAISHKVEIERVLGDFNPPSQPGARQSGSASASVRLDDGSERSIEVSVDIRGGDRTEVLLRRQFGAQALPAWHQGASSVPDPGKNPTAPQPILYLARGDDGTLLHGWADPSELADWPSDIRDEIEAGGNQGVVVRSVPTDLSPVVAEVLGALDDERNVLLYGPPGTGKTYLMTTVWKLFLEGWRRVVVMPSASPQVMVGPLADRWSTFHPSYTYETFVAGYTPVPASSGFSLQSQPGPALEAAETARRNGTGLLMIDEFNRGNASRIFGELVTVLERDKRLDTAGVQRTTTIPVRLANVDSTTTVQIESGPVSVPVPFEMPDRVYTVGSMNSVDRTVAPLDAAVRRRFRVVELRPDLDALAQRLVAAEVPLGVTSTAEEWGGLAVAVLRALNRRISHLAGPDFELGHGYLWALGDLGSGEQRRAALVTIWMEKIYPQIEETFRTRPDAVAAAIRLDGRPPSGYPYEWVRPPLSLEEAGGLAYVTPRSWGGDAVAHDRWFRFLAELESAAARPSTTAGAAMYEIPDGDGSEQQDAEDELEADGGAGEGSSDATLR